MDYYDDATLSWYGDVDSDAITAGSVSGSDLDAVTAGPVSVSHHQVMTPGCSLYKFVVDMINGLVCVLGFVGNLVAFAVFHTDTMKTSTSFLFQVANSHVNKATPQEKTLKNRIIRLRKSRSLFFCFVLTWRHRDIAFDQWCALP